MLRRGNTRQAVKSRNKENVVNQVYVCKVLCIKKKKKKKDNDKEKTIGNRYDRKVIVRVVTPFPFLWHSLAYAQECDLELQQVPLAKLESVRISINFEHKLIK